MFEYINTSTNNNNNNDSGINTKNQPKRDPYGNIIDDEPENNTFFKLMDPINNNASGSNH